MGARSRGAIFLVAATVLVPATSGAQPDDSSEKDKAADKTKPADAAPPPAGDAAGKDHVAIPEPAFTWEPFGYLRMQYIVVQNDPNIQFIGRDDGFELQNARLGFRGTYQKRARFVFAIDGAVDERAQINVPEGKLRVGLRDAYADLAVSGDVEVRGGFFQTVLDTEALVGDLKRDFVDRPIESRGMRATEGFQTPGLTPGHSLGAALRLDPLKPDGSGVGVGFELAVQNGADEFASNNDNDKPAVSAAVIARFPHDSWLVVGARFNPRTVGDLPFRQDEDDYQGMAAVRFDAGPLVLGAGVFVQQTRFATTGGPEQNAFGGHGQAMIKLGDGTAMPFAVGYRFGILDPSSLITTDRVMEHTAGVVLGVPKLRMRVQLQLTHVIEERELSNDRAQIAAEIVL
jgi:hypothetical protein